MVYSLFDSRGECDGEAEDADIDAGILGVDHGLVGGVLGLKDQGVAFDINPLEGCFQYFI